MGDLLKFQLAIRERGNNLIRAYEESNEILTGSNGPYDDEEFRVRNLCHLIIITSIEILRYEKKEYLNLLEKMGKELLGLRMANGFFALRNTEKKDTCNGVIGHSWVLEGLLYLYKVLRYEEILNICFEIAESHEFNEKHGLWYVPFHDGNEKQIDDTFNHQLWYAASLAELLEVKEKENLRRQLDTFMNKVNRNMSLSLNGKISHSIFHREDMKGKLRQKIKRGLDACNQILDRSSYAYKEQGYHMFNLMAFARLYKFYKEDPFFASLKFRKVLKYVNTKQFKEGLLNPNFSKDISLNNPNISEKEQEINIYGFPYNVPGFELLYVSLCFRGKINQNVVEWCLKKQFELTYDVSKKRFGVRCHDKNTINYRIYEFYRYLELI